jgi:hypothetical protein
MVAALRPITLIYHRLTVFSGNSKFVGGDSRGIRFPLPAPHNSFICNILQGGETSDAFSSVQTRYSGYLVYFQYVDGFGHPLFVNPLYHPRFVSLLYKVTFAYVRLRSAQRIIGPLAPP